jgi:glycosyltransferase involved in cell wall biosynthesis
LIDNVFPRVVDRVADARLLLVGRPPTQRMLEAAKRDPRVVVTGGVEDVRPYLAVANVSAIALNYGGGTRLKILEAFAAGVPVVSTTKGAEGIAAEHGREIVLANTPEAMAQAILDIFARAEDDRRQETAALALVRESYSLESLRRRLTGALPALAAQSEATVTRDASATDRNYIGV